VQRDVRSILACTKGAEPTIETVPWPVLEPLFDRAVGLKPTKYPSLVFGSKLCHFILPAAFVVVDNVLTGVPGSYAPHWLRHRELWLGCETREKLKTYLGDKIRKLSSCEPGDDYPWATKIVELCLIGSRAS
jgi:hypothetical protein